MLLRDQCDWSELLEPMTILIDQVVRRSAVIFIFRATNQRLLGYINLYEIDVCRGRMGLKTIKFCQQDTQNIKDYRLLNTGLNVRV